MDKLWSPWRSAYISSFKSDETQRNNSELFTRVIKEDRDKENLILQRGKTCFIIMNLYPYNAGHLMVVPYQQAERLESLDEETRLELINLIDKSCQLLKQTLNAEGFNIGANLGKCAGAGIDNHLHFHIVPRWNGDVNFMPVISDTKVISEMMEQTYDKLKSGFEKLI